MGKKEFTELIERSHGVIKQLFDLAVPLYSNVNEANYLTNVMGGLDYLNHLSEDLKEDLIPESFYDFLGNTVNEMQITNIEHFMSQHNSTNIQKQDIENVLINSSIQSAPFNRYMYLFFKSLNFVEYNTVIVGANGSGKTTLASMLKNHIPSQNGIVIPSQKLLIIPTLESIPNYSKTEPEFNSFQKKTRNDRITYSSNKVDDFPYQESKDLSSEFNIILRNLIAERSSINNRYCDKVKSGGEAEIEDLSCTLDKAIYIWNTLIEHRELFCDANNNLQVKVKSDGQSYPAYQMSDGEKVILYLIARIILAPQDGFIIIDEPELYLHRAIVDKLWNQLEFERKDCVFIYMTHDLDFASNRVAKKYWIRNFEYPMIWSIESIPDNDIPESLLMELLGSRKKILFCEGRNSGESLDLPIYETLFPDYTIRGVRSCKDVINYTKAFNKISNRNATAYGLIDRDFRTVEELNCLRNENIYSLEVAEVENLFLIECFIRALIAYKNESCDIEKIKIKLIKKLDQDKEQQVSNYVSSRINYHFKESHVRKGNTKEEISKYFDSFKDEINIEQWYSERLDKINKIIDNEDYEKAIMIYNNKGLHGIVEDVLGYKSNEYRKKALSFLQDIDEAKNILRNKFPTEINVIKEK